MKKQNQIALAFTLVVFLLVACNDSQKRPKLKIDESNSFRTMDVEEEYSSKQDSNSITKKEIE